MAGGGGGTLPPVVEAGFGGVWVFGAYFPAGEVAFGAYFLASFGAVLESAALVSAFLSPAFLSPAFLSAGLV